MKQKKSYLAVDAHSSHCQMAVMAQEGQLLSCKNYRTSATELIEAVSKISGYKSLVVEESQMADWIKRTLQPYVDELIVSDPKVNHWIAKAECMNDSIAAVRLAHLPRGGYIKSVYHPDCRRQEFKGLVLHYHDLTNQITRFKNKIKAEFISCAVGCRGSLVYQPVAFPGYLKKIPDRPLTKFQTQNYFDILQQIISTRNEVLKKIRSFYDLYPEINQLRLIPGIGQVGAFTISAIVDTPQRFSNKRKLWSYCALGKSQKISNGKIYANGPAQNGNRFLKHIFIHAAHTALRCKADSAFKQTAKRLKDSGVSDHNIKRTLARQIISVVLNLWRSGESYKPMI